MHVTTLGAARKAGWSHVLGGTFKGAGPDEREIILYCNDAGLVEGYDYLTGPHSVCGRTITIS